MGLTRESAAHSLDKPVTGGSGWTVLLAGNPNVGKSTVFNALTGMHQHTGNWSGKTVGNARGEMKYKDISSVTAYRLFILPMVLIKMKNGEEFKFAVFFGRKRFVNTLRSMGVDA